MKQFSDCVKKKFLAEPTLVNLWLENALEYQRKAEQFLDATHPAASETVLRGVFDFFSNYLANAIHVPHRLSWVFQDAKEMEPEFVAKLTEVRVKNHVPGIEKICLDMMGKLIADAGHLKHIGVINPLEVFKEVVWPSKAEIVRREKGWLLILCDGDQRFFSGENAIKAHRSLLNVTFPAHIKGSVVYKGRVKGRVVVTGSREDLKRIKSGDVVVTNMTTPEYIPYLKDAAAVVTDEGGITCHAAIVSRELKKPCIIGTKIATRVLKDGDMVEVDANNGVVKIIS